MSQTQTASVRKKGGGRRKRTEILMTEMRDFEKKKLQKFAKKFSYAKAAVEELTKGFAALIVIARNVATSHKKIIDMVRAKLGVLMNGQVEEALHSLPIDTPDEVVNADNIAMKEFFGGVFRDDKTYYFKQQAKREVVERKAAKIA